MGEDRMEWLAQRVHEAWMAEKVRQGFHAPGLCERAVDSPFRAVHCEWCHPDIRHYSRLPENVREYDRAAVRGIRWGLAELGLTVAEVPELGSHEHREAVKAEIARGARRTDHRITL